MEVSLRVFSISTIEFMDAMGGIKSSTLDSQSLI
jgi:hypothetical protein